MGIDVKSRKSKLTEKLPVCPAQSVKWTRDGISSDNMTREMFFSYLLGSCKVERK